MQTEKNQYQVKLQIIPLPKGIGATSTLGRGVDVYLYIYVYIKLYVNSTFSMFITYIAYEQKWWKKIIFILLSWNKWNM